MHTQLASALVLALASLSHADPIVHLRTASPVSVGAFSLYPPTGFYDFVFNYSQGRGRSEHDRLRGRHGAERGRDRTYALDSRHPYHGRIDVQLILRQAYLLRLDLRRCSGAWPLVAGHDRSHRVQVCSRQRVLLRMDARASSTRENEPVQVLEWAYQAQPNLAIAAGDAGVPTCPPQIIAMTPPMEVEIGTFVELPVRAAGENLSYQWLRNGESIDPEDPSTTGSWTDTLVIFSTVPEDTLAYTLRVTSSCGTVTTDPVMLVVAPPAPDLSSFCRRSARKRHPRSWEA